MFETRKDTHPVSRRTTGVLNTETPVVERSESPGVSNALSN